MTFGLRNLADIRTDLINLLTIQKKKLVLDVIWGVKYDSGAIWGTFVNSNIEV